MRAIPLQRAKALVPILVPLLVSSFSLPCAEERQRQWNAAVTAEKPAEPKCGSCMLPDGIMQQWQ